MKIMSRVKPSKDEGIGIKLDFLMSDKADEVFTPRPDISNQQAINTINEGKKKRKRKKPVDGDIVKPSTEESSEQLPFCASNEPYIDSYQETNNMYRQTINEADSLLGQLDQNIKAIMANKTMRNKYHVLANLVTASASLMGTRMSAINGINKSITDSHNLDMKRMKDLNSNVAPQDDNARIQELYAAYANMPMGTYDNSIMAMMPTTQDMSTGNVMSGNPNIPAQFVSPQQSEELRNVMMNENPNIEEVVIMDQSLPYGENIRFAVIDKNTMQDVPGAVPPDPSFIANLKLDEANGVARDVNLNRTYRLIVLNGNNGGGIY